MSGPTAAQLLIQQTMDIKAAQAAVEVWEGEGGLSTGARHARDHGRAREQLTRSDAFRAYVWCGAAGEPFFFF